MRHVDLAFVPTWLFWVSATAGYGVLIGVLFRMMPPPLRRAWGRQVTLASMLVLAPIVFARDPRGILWFCTVGFTAFSLPLLWMGRLPADMPSARDPACRLHPEYAHVARRGRITGVVIVVITVAMAALTAFYVQGL